MKKLILVIFAIISGGIYAQKNIADSIPIIKPRNIYCEFPAYTVPAEFPDEIDVFKQKILNQINEKFLEKAKNRNWATEISFDIEKDGAISHITAAGKNKKLNEKAVEATKRVRGKWIPALKGGNPVIEKFKLLLNF